MPGLVALADCLLVSIPPLPLLRLLETDGSFARCAARLFAERMLRDLAASGVVQVAGREISILDRAALGRLAGNEG